MLRIAEVFSLADRMEKERGRLLDMSGISMNLYIFGSQCGSVTSSISITYQLVRNAESQPHARPPPSETSLTMSFDNLCAQLSLRSTFVDHFEESYYLPNHELLYYSIYLSLPQWFSIIFYSFLKRGRTVQQRLP